MKLYTHKLETQGFQRMSSSQISGFFNTFRHSDFLTFLICYKGHTVCMRFKQVKNFLMQLVRCCSCDSLNSLMYGLINKYVVIHKFKCIFPTIQPPLVSIQFFYRPLLFSSFCHDCFMPRDLDRSWWKCVIKMFGFFRIYYILFPFTPGSHQLFYLSLSSVCIVSCNITVVGRTLSRKISCDHPWWIKVK